jgi:hypothetical protein
MAAKSTMPMGFLLAAGCAVHAPPPAIGSPPPSEAVSAARARPPEPGGARPEGGPVAELGLPAKSAFDTQRQIDALRAAIALYTQFLERATGRPELEPAVKKARERIADAQQAIVFLEN